MGERAEQAQTEETEFWPTKDVPEQGPPEDEDQSAAAIALIEAGIEESVAKREPTLQVTMPDGTRKYIGRFLNTRYFWDLPMDIETRREIIAHYTKIDKEYSPLGVVPPLLEDEEAETPSVTSTEEALPRISLPPTQDAPKPDPYAGKDWAQRAAGEKNEDD